MSTYTSYNSYLGNKSCCKSLCSLCVSSGTTGPTGPQGIQGVTGPAGQGMAQGLGAVLQVNNSANIPGTITPQSIEGVGTLGAANIIAPFGEIQSFGSSLIQSAGGFGNLAILPVNNLTLKGAQTKGSILAGDGTSTKELVVGADGLFLKADSGSVLGVSWAAGHTGPTGAQGSTGSTGPTGSQGIPTTITAGTNIGITGTASVPIVNIQNPLTSVLNILDQNITGTTGNLVLNNASDSITYSASSITRTGNTTFPITAVDAIDITSTAGVITLDASANDINLNAGAGIYAIANGSMNFTSTNNDINLTAAGGINLTAAGGINLTSPTLVKSGDTTAATTGYLFVAEVSEQYSTSNGGRAARCDEPITISGATILKKCNYFSTDGDCNLLKADKYANSLQPNKDGWFCYIQNYGGNSINVTTDDGTPFYGNGNGNQLYYTMPEYTTARFTLTYISSLSSYIWSVLQG